jgi:hypothetical protein
MNEQHTVGPWAVNWAGSGRDGVLVYDEVYVYAPACGVEDIAVAADIADPLTGKPSKANALLIAAAPCLLAALREFIDEHASHTLTETERLAKARAAIARALPQGAPDA